MDKQTVINLLQKLGFAPQKQYGQNFLISASIAQKICDVVLNDESETIYEIGPGLGSLSNNLVTSKKKIKLVEIDHGFASYLQKQYEKLNHVEVIDKDVLKVKFLDEKLSIVSNLPYYITTAIIEKVIIECPNIINFVFMTQVEMRERLFALPHTKQYGPLAILLTITGTTSQLVHVDKSLFYPIPLVNSVVYVYRPSKHNLDLANLYPFIKSLFLLRRKTIYNNLQNAGFTSEEAEKLLLEAKIDPKKRPEDLLPEQFVTLFNMSQLLFTTNKQE